MLATIAAIFWFCFAALGWIVVAILSIKPRKDGDDPPDDPPPTPAAAVFLARRQEQRARATVPHALEPPWDEPPPT